jgi:hypothetical protein
MSMSSSLRERFGQRVRYVAGNRVQSGSPARYRLRADNPLTLTISAMKALGKRHVSIVVAKPIIEQIMHGGEVVVDLPMLEDAAAFEKEMHDLGIAAVREARAAAAEG